MTKPSQSILIVEDEFWIRTSAVDMALDAGFIVFEAASADPAIAILEAHPEIGLVFTDIEMPGSMDGLKLAAYVSNRWPPIRLIVTSGRISLDKDALPAGSLFFSKPYHHAAIAAAMHGLFAA